MDPAPAPRSSASPQRAPEGPTPGFLRGRTGERTGGRRRLGPPPPPPAPRPRPKGRLRALRPGFYVEGPVSVLVGVAAFPVLPVALGYEVVVPARSVHREPSVPSNRLAVHDDALEAPLQHLCLTAWFSVLV